MSGVSTPDDFAYALDPVLFGESIGFTPYKWQSDFLRASHQRVLLNCSRGAGKSSACALLAAHRALFYPDSLILVISPSERQSNELFRTINGFLDHLEVPPVKIEDLKTSFKLINSSRVVALPGSEGSIRGFQGVDLLLIDEASRCQSELIQSVTPMIGTSGGRIVLLSTPWGKRGYYFEAWSTGGDDWYRFEVPASECPRLGKEFLESERRSLGEYHYRQEYECQFSETRDAVFSYESIQAALSDDITPLFSERTEDTNGGTVDDTPVTPEEYRPAMAVRQCYTPFRGL